MIVRRQLFVFATALLQVANIANGQTEVLDVDALGNRFVFGELNRDRTEFLYVLDDPGGGAQALFSTSLVNVGSSRPLPTQGVEVTTIGRDVYGGRILVRDLPNVALFSVDVVGNSPPIPLSPEPSYNGFLAPTQGHVAIIVEGNAGAPNAADRDQVYTRSILGGPAVEITGGLPLNIGLSDYAFSGDGNTLVLGTASASDPNLLNTSAVYFATPGVTGLTRVLGSMPANARFLLIGGDAAGEYYTFEVHRPVEELWSVSTSNPTIASKLNVDAGGSSIGYVSKWVDPERGRMLFHSIETIPNPNWIWEAPLDGSSAAQVLTRLPTGQTPSSVIPVDGSPWIYARTNEPFTSNTRRVYAFPADGGEAIEFRSPAGNSVALTTIYPDGSKILFSDARTAGNDLYLGRPGEQTDKLITLLDVPNTDRLVRAFFSSDGEHAIVALGKTTLGSQFVADRLLAVPLDGGPVVTLDDGTIGPDTFQISNGGNAAMAAGDYVFYLKGYTNGQAGFYVVKIPQPGIHGDYNEDGVVNAVDYVVWRRSVGAPAGTLPNDPDGGVIGPAQYSTWRANFGATSPSSAVALPEPSSFSLLLLLVIAGRARKLDS